MKKLIFILLLSTSLNVLSANINDIKWYSFVDVVQNYNKLKPYDIIILEKGNTFYSQWGHCFILNNDLKLLEFKGYSEYYVDNPLYSFIELDRKVAVLRYAELTDELREKMEESISDYYNKNYSVFVNNNSNSYYTYCSKFIYNLYNNLGIKLTKDKWPIYPYDFLDSPLLTNIKISE